MGSSGFATNTPSGMPVPFPMNFPIEVRNKECSGARDTYLLVLLKVTR